MEFQYGAPRSGNALYENWHQEKDRYERIYGLKVLKPAWEMVKPDTPSLRPFESKHCLSEKLFSDHSCRPSDFMVPPLERARLQGKQVSLLLEQLAARHSINEQIRRDLQYSESKASSKLSEINDRMTHYGSESRFASELIKELNQIQKAKHAEHVSCWRDTNRLMGDLFESWREYEENTSKGRLMDFDF